MDDLQLYALFNSISVISGQWVDDNKRLCKGFMVEKISPQERIKPSEDRTCDSRPVLNPLTSGAPSSQRSVCVCVRVCVGGRGGEGAREDVRWSAGHLVLKKKTYNNYFNIMCTSNSYLRMANLASQCLTLWLL